MPIPSPQSLLRTHGLRPKNSFGQNFLADANLTRKIAEEATHDPGVVVLELGAGLGALTDQLLARGARVVAVERDRELVPVLREIFEPYRREGQLTIVEADAKTLDWEQALESQLGGSTGRWVVAGNLPYQITGPLLEKTVGLASRLSRAVFLLQKEVADRLVATPGTKSYGALGVFTQAQFEVRRAFSIGRASFVPQPRVDSAVVVLEPRRTPVAEETSAFRRVVKSAFAARRKTLRNAWKGLLPGPGLQLLAESCGIDLELRGETLSVEEFAKVARALSEAEGDGR